MKNVKASFEAKALKGEEVAVAKEGDLAIGTSTEKDKEDEANLKPPFSFPITVKLP